jgi:hypothetical protein
MSTSVPIDVPDELAALHTKDGDHSGRAWVAALNPEQVAVALALLEHR